MKNWTMRGVLLLFVWAVGAAWGQPYPGKPEHWKPEKNVEIVLGIAAGSNQDRIARTIQSIWRDKGLGLLNVASSVVHRPGGGGAVAWVYMNQHAGDPHYLQVASPTMLINHITGVSPYNFTDSTPIALLGSQYAALAVRLDSPLKSGRDLLERLRKDPASVAFGTNNRGSTLHILIATVVKTAGADVRTLKMAVFQGGELMTALLGGHIDVIATVASSILPHMQAGKMRMIGIAAPRRLAGTLAEVATWKEQGVEAVVPNWAGVMGTKGMSSPQITFWDGVFARTVQTDEWKQELERNFWEAQYLNSADYTKYLRDEYAQHKPVLTDLGLVK